ncbi:sigma factor [Streptomyces sp. FH025]|uniref:sigma factor n=1 Tax=Streptomyces sp. FH025 TaxID=2815937 RepID=UPI0027DC0A53|nr:sigma factor [Streptomyces sp. FH025]
MPDHDRLPEHDGLAEQFERFRPHLRAVAYRVLGSHAESEEAVRETWIRFNRINPDEVDDLGAWLTTVVSRVCLDLLRVRTAPPAAPTALDGLTPDERVSFVMRDLFHLPVDQIATTLEQPTAATRRLIERARRRVREPRPGSGGFSPR